MRSFESLSKAGMPQSDYQRQVSIGPFDHDKSSKVSKVPIMSRVSSQGNLFRQDNSKMAYIPAAMYTPIMLDTRTPGGKTKFSSS